MNLEVEWVPIEHGVYAAIYATLYRRLTVFGSFTQMEDEPGGREMMTEWGFKDADAPLIKAHTRGFGEDAEHAFWIAKVKRGDEE